MLGAGYASMHYAFLREITQLKVSNDVGKHNVNRIQILLGNSLVVSWIFYKVVPIFPSELTKHVDKGVGQQVAELVGHVTLVDGAGPRPHVAENHRVPVHRPAGVLRRVYQGITG